MLRVSSDEAQAVSQDAVFMPLETPLDMPAQDLASHRVELWLKLERNQRYVGARDELLEDEFSDQND